MVRIRINYKIVFLSLIITVLMYPRTVESILANMKRIRIAGKMNASAVSYIGTGAEEYKSRVVFMFDDGWKSVHIQAFPLMDKYGYRGSVSIIPSMVDKDEYMSYAQLSELYLEGWDMLNHSYSHREGMYDSPDALFMDFNKARQWMKNRYLGKSSDIAIMPYGEVNPYLLVRLKEAGYRNIRTSDNIIVLDKYKTRYYPITTINLLTEVTVSEVEDILRKAFDEPKTIIIILHKIGDEYDSFGMTYSGEKFEQILGYIAEHNDIFSVIPYSQLF